MNRVDIHPSPAVVPMVTFEDVTKRFGGTGNQPAFTALDGVSMMVPRGAITGMAAILALYDFVFARLVFWVFGE